MPSFKSRIIESINSLCSFDGIKKTIGFFFLSSLGFLFTQVDFLKEFIGLELSLERFGIYGYLYIILIFPTSATIFVALIACYSKLTKNPHKVLNGLSIFLIFILNVVVCWWIYQSSLMGKLWIRSNSEIQQITVKENNIVPLFTETPKYDGELYQLKTKIPFGSYNLIISYLDIDKQIKRELLPISLNSPRDTIYFQTLSSVIGK